MDIEELFIELRRLVEGRKFHKGSEIKTSILGKVPSVQDPLNPKKSIGYITKNLQQVANENGFKILYADFEENSYTLEILYDPLKSNRENMQDIYINHFCCSNYRVSQLLNTDDDSISFVADQKTETKYKLFLMDNDTRTTFFDKDNREILVGKFSYNDDYSIKFTFNKQFIENHHPEIDVLEIAYPTKDFLVAEMSFVKQMLNDNISDKTFVYFLDDLKSRF